MQSEWKGFVPCDHEYLNFKGAKIAKSHGAFVAVPYFLSKYDPDALRFYLTATAPETRETPTAVLLGGLCGAEQPCPERKRRTRVGGHLGHAGRGQPHAQLFVQTLRGQVPEPCDPSSSSGQGLDDEDQALLEKVEAGFETVGELLQERLQVPRGAGRSAGPCP